MELPTLSKLVAKLQAKDYEVILEQLADQEADTEAEKQNFIKAYAWGKYYALAVDFMLLEIEHVEALVFELARLTYPRENHFGFRNYPAYHRKTHQPIGLPPGCAIKREFKAWVEAFVEGEMPPDELYFWFERIHPFRDGNGRLGHIMWAMAVLRITGKWPLRLPPEYREPILQY